APVFISRVTDRIGKGIRTASRDALLAAESDKKHLAKVFGFHRAFDTVGAAIGPAIALVYLYFYPQDYKGLFVFAVLPTAASALLTLVLKEKKNVAGLKKSVVGEDTNNGINSSPLLVSSPTIQKVSLFSFIKYWK